MYSFIEKTIQAGGYRLDDIQRKIKKLYLSGDITEEEFDRLYAMAIEGISADAERPELTEMLLGISRRIDGLEERLAALEKGSSGGSSSDGGDSAEEAWTPWDGISEQYQQGAVVTHNGKVWESVFAGQNVWEPGAVGTETLWKELTGGTA